MSYDTNVYYNPEKFGLKPLAEIDFSSGSYEFDYRVVWVSEEGALYTARDSGCSCPTPFEDFNSVADLERVDFKALKSEVEGEIRDGSEDSYYSYGVSASEARSFLDVVEAELARWDRR